MRKSILIIATVVLSIINIHATNKKMTNNISIEVTEITKEHIAKIFDWKVETNKGTYSGTTSNLETAKHMIDLSSSGEIIKDFIITSYYILKSEAKIKEKRNYFWEVETTTGFAKGYSSSLNFANKMIQLVASGDVIVSKIIISQPQK